MKKSLLIVFAMILLISLISIPIVFSDDDRWEDYRQKSLGVSVNKNPQYQEECGSCHMAYQPGLLTASSWSRIIQGLDNHFGDNAELDDDTQLSILQFIRNITLFLNLLFFSSSYCFVAWVYAKIKLFF